MFFETITLLNYCVVLGGLCICGGLSYWVGYKQAMQWGRLDDRAKGFKEGVEEGIKVERERCVDILCKAMSVRESPTTYWAMVCVQDRETEEEMVKILKGLCSP